MANVEPQGGAAMKPEHLCGVSEEDSDPDIEEIGQRRKTFNGFS